MSAVYSPHVKFLRKWGIRGGGIGSEILNLESFCLKMGLQQTWKTHRQCFH